MTSAGFEIELKLQVPAAARDAVQRAVATKTARRTPLHAVYADTVDHRLAAAGLVLRMRQEDRRWVQTLKGRGDGLLQRLEHEVVLPPQCGTPAIDPARHAGSAAAEALRRALDGQALQPVYRTEILRTHRRVRSGGATVEIAFDEGRIVAGTQVLAVCELEFELVAGPPAALPALALRWLQRHALWLDVRSKSERGLRLALGVQAVPATKAAPVEFGAAHDDAGAAVGAMLRGALAQALPNAAELAGDDGGAAHVHQLRVALRRLRTALRLFGGWTADPPAAAALEAALRAPFVRLGAARDADVLRETLWPVLLAAGAPPPAARAAAPPEAPQAIVLEAAFGAALLQTLALSLTVPAQPLALRPAAARVLKSAHQRVAADAAQFEQAAPALQHRARKRLKRLRYATEFLQPLLPPKPARRALKTMREAADTLGAYTDALLAEDRFRAEPEPDAAAWFALGWLAARRGTLCRKAAKGLARIARLPRYWG